MGPQGAVGLDLVAVEREPVPVVGAVLSRLCSRLCRNRAP